MFSVSYFVLKMSVEKYFASRNLYAILQVKPDATIQDGKKIK